LLSYREIQIIVTLLRRRKNLRKRSLTQNLIIYVTPMVKKVIGVQHVLKKERKVVQVEVVEVD